MRMEWLRSAWLFLACMSVWVAEARPEIIRDPHSPGRDAPGRIAALDKELLKHGKAISDGSNLKPLKKALTKLVKTTDEDPQMEQYYLDVVALLEEEGASGLKLERERLNSIITSLSGRSDGQAEIDYSLKRRNILEAFIDSAAEHILAELNLPGLDIPFDEF